MSLQLLPVQDQITNKLKELAQDVYENGVPEDSSLSFDTSGTLLPFIVIVHSSMTQRANERGITGPRQDLGRCYADVMCVGPNERSVRQVLDLVVDKLTGFQPTDAGILMIEASGKPYTTYDGGSRPVKYVAEASFYYSVNTVVS